MKTILVVDDEYDIVEILQDILEGEGYRVIGATDGRQGLEIVAKDRPDLILLDLMMPIMGGLDMLDRLRASAEHNSIPVVLMSAAQTALDSRQYDDLVFLAKPFQLENLMDAIMETIGPGNG